MLEPDVIALLESDAVAIVGTVDPEGIPEATRGWLVRVLDGTEPRVRFLAPVDAARFHANITATGRIAVTVTDVETLASAQVKGHLVTTEPATAADLRAQARSFEELARKIHETDGTDLDVVRRFAPGPLGAVILTIEEVYDQTPGPGAGVRLAPTADAS